MFSDIQFYVGMIQHSIAGTTGHCVDSILWVSGIFHFLIVLIWLVAIVNVLSLVIV